MRDVDLETWPRRDHFEFFRRYEKPFFNLCAEVDVTAARSAAARPGGPSFFAATLHASLVAVNSVPEFGYRLRDAGVVAHEPVHAGCTILREDDTFGFGYFPYERDLSRFDVAVRGEVDRVRASTDLTPSGDRDDLVRYSVIPWVRFTSFAHAGGAADGSIPKIVFGRYADEDGRCQMPVSVEVHHALMDGVHVGRFFSRFQAELDHFAER